MEVVGIDKISRGDRQKGKEEWGDRGRKGLGETKRFGRGWRAEEKLNCYWNIKHK